MAIGINRRYLGVGVATGEGTTCGVEEALAAGETTGETFAPIVGEGDGAGG